MRYCIIVLEYEYVQSPQHKEARASVVHACIYNLHYLLANIYGKRKYTIKKNVQITNGF